MNKTGTWCDLAALSLILAFNFAKLILMATVQQSWVG